MLGAWSTSWWGQAESPGTVQLGRRRLRGSWSVLLVGGQEDGAGLRLVVPSDRGHKVELWDFHLSRKEKFCAV